MTSALACETIRARIHQAWLRLWLPEADKKLLKWRSPYEDWRSVNIPSRARCDDLAEALESHAVADPAISIVMPVFKPRLDLLEAAVRSVQEQSLAQWELCICDDGSDDSGLTAHLERIAQSDPRIRLTSLASNAGISVATNAAAEMAGAPVLLFLDQDDLLSPTCLAEFVLAFATDDKVDLAYSDNDKLDLSGQHTGPAFKPGWSPTLLLSHMYAGHAMAVKTALFRELGGMRREHDGSQDYDFFLRASESARRVAHLPNILYHWRIMPGSTALSAKEKPASVMAGMRAVEDALTRRGVPAKVEWPDWAERAGIGLFSLTFQPASQPVVVIVHSADNQAPDRAWLEHLSKLLPTGSEVIDTADRAASHGLPERLTAAFRRAEGLPVLLLRSGALPTRNDWLNQLSGYLGLENASVAGGRVIGTDSKVINCGFVQPNGAEKPEPAFAGLAAHRPGSLYLARVARECLAVSADCLLIRPDLAAALGPVPDEVHDGDTLGLWISRRARESGRSAICCPDSEVIVQQRRPAPLRARADGIDVWYNSNLGAGRTQFKPARRAVPPQRQRRLRVAAVSHNLDREGAQTLLVDLLCDLKAQGLVDPVVITPKGGELETTLTTAGIPIWHFAPEVRRISKERLDNRVAALAAAYTQANADVVLANTLEMYAAVEAAERAGIGAVWWQHEGGSWRSYFKALRPWIRARAFAAFSTAYRVIQVADFTRKAWLPVALRDNFELVRHGIAPERLQDPERPWSRMSARAELGLNDDVFCIVLMGSISARKGQLDIIQALALVPDDIASRLSIKIVGATVEQRYGERITKALGTLPEARRTQVELVGRVSDTALYYNAADVLVCCSRQESAPLAIVEAMHFGVPIVTTPVDGIPELIEVGGNALVYNPGNITELAATLADLASSIACLSRLRTRGLELAHYVNNRKLMIKRFAQLLREAAMLRGTMSSPTPE